MQKQQASEVFFTTTHFTSRLNTHSENKSFTRCCIHMCWEMHPNINCCLKLFYAPVISQQVNFLTPRISPMISPALGRGPVDILSTQVTKAKSTKPNSYLPVARLQSHCSSEPSFCSPSPGTSRHNRTFPSHLWFGYKVSPESSCARKCRNGQRWND